VTTKTGVEELPVAELPQRFRLIGNYPNPFNAGTEIMFAAPCDGNVTLSVYNIKGQKVKTLMDNEHVRAGQKIVRWDGTNSGGEQVASGIYYYKLFTKDGTQTMKMTLLK
jgi:hypothetical protein